MDTIGIALQAVMDAGMPVAVIAAAAAIISSVVWIWRGLVKSKAHGGANVTVLGPDSSEDHVGHGHHGGHGGYRRDPEEDDPEEEFRSRITEDVRAISIKLDRLALLAELRGDRGQKKPSRTPFLPYVLGNVFWSIFGVIMGLVIEATLNAPGPTYDGF